MSENPQPQPTLQGKLMGDMADWELDQFGRETDDPYWGDENELECPKCGSNDIKVDVIPTWGGTEYAPDPDILTCNACEYSWDTGDCCPSCGSHNIQTNSVSGITYVRNQEVEMDADWTECEDCGYCWE